MTKEFNVPSVMRITDSFGNENIYSDNPQIARHILTDPSSKDPKTLYMGDQFTINIEMDPSFPESEYQINWHKKEGLEILDNGRKIVATIGNALIGEAVELIGTVISNKEWHRFGSYDQLVVINFKALPSPTM